MVGFTPLTKDVASCPRDASLRVCLRRKRHALFLKLIGTLDQPVTVLDVGGTPAYWRLMQHSGAPDLDVTILNIEQQEVVSPGVRTILADAREMALFGDLEFDVVFSNSVIEHVGTFDDQQGMAKEIRRVARRYFVQTPNKFFPIEPHFMFPLFQFLPLALRAWLVHEFSLGAFHRNPDLATARKKVGEISLLSRWQLQRLFPDAQIHRERVMGFAKSFVACGGWD